MTSEQSAMFWGLRFNATRNLRQSSLKNPGFFFSIFIYLL